MSEIFSKNNLILIIKIGKELIIIHLLYIITLCTNLNEISSIYKQLKSTPIRLVVLD